MVDVKTSKGGGLELSEDALRSSLYCLGPCFFTGLQLELQRERQSIRIMSKMDYVQEKLSELERLIRYRLQLRGINTDAQTVRTTTGWSRSNYGLCFQLLLTGAFQPP